jgi:hypothetical protein
VVNVNDDLTIPQFQQDHSIGLPQGAPVNYPFNAFLTQITQLNGDGEPIYDAQDVAIDSIQVDGTNCGSLNTLEVSVFLSNLGDDDYPANSPISFYIGNPNSTAANLVFQDSTDAVVPAAGTSLQLFDIPSTCFTGDLFAVINDNGSIAPPFTDPGNTYAECDYANNVAGSAYICGDAFVVTCPADVNTVNDAGICFAAITAPAPTFVSACGSVTLVNDFNGTADASDTYPVGTTTVEWTVTDGTGATETCTQTITISDTESPTITCPVDQTGNYDASCEFTVPDYTGLATTGDNCGSVTVSQSPAIGSTQTGDFTVTLTADDGNGNTTDCSFDVTLTDNTAPVITVCQTDLTVSVDGSCEYDLADFTGTVTATDNCTAPGALVVTQSPAIGTTLTGDGTTQLVTLTVDDGNGNTTDCSFTITLDDDMAPTITCPVDQTGNFDASCEFTVPDYTGLATTGDNCGAVTVSQSPAIGSTQTGDFTVILTADDGNGNTTDCSFDVTLTDNTSPTITCPVDQTGNYDASCEFTVPDYTGLAIIGDNCGTVTVSQSPAIGSTQAGDFTVTLTAVDGNGNTTDCRSGCG